MITGREERRMRDGDGRDGRDGRDDDDDSAAWFAHWIEKRAANAGAWMDEYAARAGMGETFREVVEDEDGRGIELHAPGLVGEALSDLRHLCDRYGVDFQDAMEWSDREYGWTRDELDRREAEAETGRSER
jgi:hypothetical protein